MRRRLYAIICAALLSALLVPGPAFGQEPPREEGEFRKPELVELKKIDRTIGLDFERIR